jgi:hypothetical protein
MLGHLVVGRSYLDAHAPRSGEQGNFFARILRALFRRK